MEKEAIIQDIVVMRHVILIKRVVIIIKEIVRKKKDNSDSVRKNLGYCNQKIDHGIVIEIFKATKDHGTCINIIKKSKIISIQTVKRDGVKKRGNKKNYEGYNKYRSNQYIRNNNQSNRS